MAVRREVQGRILISAGKTYTFTESVRDMAGMESTGIEKLMADTLEEALSELREGERVVSMDSGFVTKNMTTHFWVVLVAEKGSEEGGVYSSSVSEAESGG